jgi:hypothetical protein
MQRAYESLPVFAQDLACTWAGYQRSRARFTPHFHRTLAELERSVSASLEALHEIQERPMVVAGGKIEARPMMYLALTYDHRIVDGREAVQFLVHVKDLLEDPARLLLEI